MGREPLVGKKRYPVLKIEFLEKSQKSIVIIFSQGVFDIVCNL